MYEITWDSSGVVNTFTGAVKRTEVIQALLDSAADPRLPSVKYVINDFSHCQALIVTYEALDQIAMVVNDWRKNHEQTTLNKVAFVVSDPTISVELEDYAARLSKGVAIEFFKTLDAANTWVGE